MSGVTVPQVLLFEGAKLTIAVVRDAQGFAGTRSAVVVRGNRVGFLSIANVLLYLAASLRDRLSLLSLPFVTAPGIKDVVVALDDNPASPELEGRVMESEAGVIVWQLSPEQLVATAGSAIHALGYRTPDCSVGHVHIDAGMPKDGLSLYFEVTE